MRIKCQAIGCDSEIPHDLFMCARHIRLVPPGFREVALMHHRCDRLAAAGERYVALAIRIVRGKEGK